MILIETAVIYKINTHQSESQRAVSSLRLSSSVGYMRGCVLGIGTSDAPCTLHTHTATRSLDKKKVINEILPSFNFKPFQCR